MKQFAYALLVVAALMYIFMDGPCTSYILQALVLFGLATAFVLHAEDETFFRGIAASLFDGDKKAAVAKPAEISMPPRIESVASE